MTHPKPDPNCEDCKGSGEIEVETIVMSRPSMVKGELTHYVTGLGDWHMGQCHCVGEYDE